MTDAWTNDGYENETNDEAKRTGANDKPKKKARKHSGHALKK